MAELKEVFEMVTKQTEPDLDSWREQERRQRRTARNRQGGAVRDGVAAIVAALAIVAADTCQARTRPREGGQPTPTPPLVPTTSGAQIIGLDGTVRERIPGMPAGASGLKVSPDGRTIAFMTHRWHESRRSGVTAAGCRSSPATQRTAEGTHRRPSRGPRTGAQIAYVANDDIYVRDATARHDAPPHRRSGWRVFPAWSSGG